MFLAVSSLILGAGACCVDQGASGAMGDMNQKCFLTNSFDFFIENCILSLFCHLFPGSCIWVFLAVASLILVAGACKMDQGASVGDERHESKLFSPKFI